MAGTADTGLGTFNTIASPKTESIPIFNRYGSFADVNSTRDKAPACAVSGLVASLPTSMVQVRLPLAFAAL